MKFVYLIIKYFFLILSFLLLAFPSSTESKQTVLADKSLTEDEKLKAIERLTRCYDYNKVLLNEGTKRICENCQLECLAKLFCELCVRNYLKSNFSNKIIHKNCICMN